ncbi:hypothetical protein ARD30_09975 [Bosea thiooxidans]|uniref:DUF3572 domain-containing protein n=1 Tax=Bosea thiooxidans TaxID=53254 RepID=A0A0Q3I805_9HYPH|nr:DUF3572 domain-containing protein [Bosea thiooxidans]KQK31160.1 hypothetical protein ARD30_09975 [Bosea thiooxidans]SKB62534.1 Protein of unknown function [Bosea thiooxidans]
MAPRLNQEDAETLALRALGFLAAEPERIELFLSTTGLGPENLRAAASEPGFLAAVLDHIAASDSLLLEFAGNLRLNPEIVGEARRLLAGPEPDDFA